MARVFITGSADGLGQLAADALIAQGHKIAVLWRPTLVEVDDAHHS